MPRLTYPLIVIFLCMLSSALWGEEHAVSQSGRPEPVRVTTATVRLDTDSLPAEIVGTVRARHRAVISARISGTIIEMPVVLGSRVNKGDLLVKVDAQEIGARLLQAQAQLAQARRNLQREEKLLRQHASTQETVKSMRDMVAIAEAGYKEAKSMLDYTTITAPFDGVITEKPADLGDLATPGTPLLHLEDDQHLQVVVALPESLGLGVHLDDRLQVILPAASLAMEGQVAELSPMIDPATRTMTAKLDIESRPALRTGMFARVRLSAGTRRTLLVPASAVVRAGQLSKVFVVRDNRAWLRLVRTGRRQGDQVEILSGLRAGETVVISGNQRLVNDQPLILD